MTRKVTRFFTARVCRQSGSNESWPTDSYC
jgi:hypothetical protein